MKRIAEISMSLMVTLLLMISGLGCDFFSYKESKIVLENNFVRIEFSDSFTLEEIFDKETGERYSFSGSPLWRITAVDTNASTTDESVFVTVTPLNISTEKEYSIDEREDVKILHLQWNMPQFKTRVDVEIKLPKDSSLSYWSIDIENNNDRYAIWYVEFPYLKIKPIGGNKYDDYLVVPRHAGVLVSDPIDKMHWSVSPFEEVMASRDTASTGFKGTYPGSYSVQFSALYDKDGDGIYLAAYDGNMYSKRFLFDGDNCDTLTYSLRQFPEKMLTPGEDYKSPYDAVVGVFHGDWMDAAEIYREWAIKQVWCSKGPLYTWEDLSETAYNLDISIGVAYRLTLDTPILYDENLENLLAMKEFFDNISSVNGVPPTYCVHLRGWSKYLDVMSEKGTPDYFPPQPRLKDFVSTLKAKNFVINVYMGDMVFDRNNPLDPESPWRWSEAQPYAMYNPLGKVYSRFRPYYACMDPSTDWWQNSLASLVPQAQEYCLADSIYWDHVPQMRLDFKKSMSHEGGGNYYGLGYREMARKYRDAGRINDPNHFICDEGECEIEIGVFDVFLNEWFNLANGNLYEFTGLGIPIPLITYIYHDYVMMAGGIRNKNKGLNGFSSPEQFGFYTAYIFVNGNKPLFPATSGMSYTFTKWKNGEMDDEWVKEMEYFGRIVKIYRIGKEPLTFGRYLRPPKLVGIGTERIIFNGHDTDIPAVLAGAFLWNDTVYIPVTNWGKTAQSIKQIDFSKCGWLPECYELSMMDENGLHHLGIYQSKIIDVDLQIESKDACFLVIKKSSSGVSIIRPRNGLYIFDRKILPLHGTVVVGGVTITVEASKDTSKVEFYIDDNLKYTDDTYPFSWFWDEWKFGIHTIKVLGYDQNGARADVITVYKIL